MDFRFRVHGIVKESESGEPIPGLVVRGFDKDMIFDDPMGKTTTDVEGRFELVYTEEAFRSIVDEQPDLYLQVWDAEEKRQLHTTENSVRWSASADEDFEISIPRDALAPR